MRRAAVGSRYPSPSMKLTVEWGKPVPMRDASRLKETKLWQHELGRQYGKEFEALYVGKANDIRGRVKGQLNNLRLMQHVRHAKAGRRTVLAGKVFTKPGQRLDVILPLVERALIRHFLSEGHDLVNIQGTQLRQHEVVSKRRPGGGRFVPSPIYLEKSRMVASRTKTKRRT